ncbi:hypothetical protein [Qipengyuania sp. Mu-71]|jgi:hypothetical protein|uniref:hypothetical protein n=1 Tax=Qipengyuania sp. Mu-71 TaxID=3121477 RepID=UPI002FE43E99
MFEFLLNPSPRALAIHMARGETRHVLSIETDLAANERIGTAVTALQASLANVGEGLQKRGPLLSPAGLSDAAGVAIDTTVRPAYRDVVASTLAAQRALEAEWSDIMTPRFPDSVAPAARVEQREHVRSRKLPDALAAAQGDLLGLGAAIVEGGQGLSGLPTDIFERLQKDVAVEGLAQRIVRDAALRTEPTLENPLGGAPDLETARANAAGRLDRLDNERALIGRVPALLSSVISAVALMTDATRQKALERLAA